MEKILSVDGSILNQKAEPKISKTILLKMYENMVLTRLLDQKGMRLQRQGRIGFNIPSTGQEATQIGAVAALKDTDWIFPAYRESGCAFYRGIPLADVINQWFGNAKDPQKGRRIPGLFGDPKIRFVNPSAPIGTQIIQAAGVSYGAKYLNDGNLSLAFFGDGATSSTDFHSGLNFAGVTKSPTIFFCQNNQWAISVPLEYQTAADNIAIKGSAYGVKSVQVDGNDVLAVYKVVSEAADFVRQNGPLLIEALTYRMGPHTSSDDPTRYRSKDEVDEQSKKDPIIRFQHYLTNKGYLTKTKIEKIRQNHDTNLNQVISESEKIPPPPIEDMFTDVYQKMPWHLKEQYSELLRIKKN